MAELGNCLDHRSLQRSVIASNLFQSISGKHGLPIIEIRAKNACQTNCHVVYYPKNYKTKNIFSMSKFYKLGCSGMFRDVPVFLEILHVLFLTRINSKAASYLLSGLFG